METSSSNREGANNVSDGPEDGLVYHHATIMITQSLTRAKGNVLSQTFLSPWDWEGGGGQVCPALGGNGNGGGNCANGKENRMIQMCNSKW